MNESDLDISRLKNQECNFSENERVYIKNNQLYVGKPELGTNSRLPFVTEKIRSFIEQNPDIINTTLSTNLENWNKKIRKRNNRIADSTILKCLDAFFKFISQGKLSLTVKELEFWTPCTSLDKNPVNALAELVAEKDPRALADNIDTYDLKDENERYTLAELVAEKDPRALADNIDKFNIEGEGKRYALAELVAKKDPRALFENIKKFDFKDKHNLFEFARYVITELSPIESFDIKSFESDLFFTYFVKSIENFDFKDEDRYRLFLKAVVKNPIVILNNIDKFNIEDEDKRYTIAYTFTGVRPALIADNIDKFNIEGEDKRYVLAELVAEKDPRGLADNIDKFNIEDEDKRYAIAYTLTRSRPALIADNIDKFNIEGEDRRYALAELVAGKNPLALAKNIDKFNIEGEDKRYALAKLFADKDPRALTLNIDNFKLTEDQYDSCFKDIVSNLVTDEPSLSPDQLNRYCQFMKKVVLGTKSPIKIRMSGAAYTMLIYKESRDSWNSILSGKTHKSYELLALFPSLLGSLADSNAIGKALLQKGLKDSRKNSALLQLLATILGSSDPDREKKAGLINQVLCKEGSSQDVIDRTIMISYYLTNNKISVLEKLINGEESLPSLNDFFSQTWKELGFTLDDERPDQCIKKFQNHLVPLLEYANNLKTLSDDKNNSCKSVLSKYVQSISNGEFPGIRYAKEGNVHLQTVLKDELEESWKQGTTYSAEEFRLDALASGASTNYKEFFYQKIISDKHISLEQIPYLAGFLEGSCTVEDAQKEIKKELQTKESAMLVFEQKVLDLLLLPKPSLQSLEEVIGKLQETCANDSLKPELLNDLQGLQKTLASKQRGNDVKLSSCKVLDTDDPFLLLMMGTDVEGSCQRVDGTPSLNKCLLAYLMDGKNRLLAIVDDNNTIVARAVLRLLVDEENKPALFLERAYFAAHCPHEFEEVLQKAAERRADALHLPLNPKGRLRSLASSAPFEYVDAQSTGVTEGVWEINVNE